MCIRDRCRTYQKLWAKSTNATVFLQPWDHSTQYVVCLCIQKTGTDHKISVNVSTRYRVGIATRPTLVRQAEHLEYDFRNTDRKSLNVMSEHTYQEGARQVDEQRRGVLPTLPHLRHHVRPETERRTAIRQTVPTKALVEAETSTIINKRLIF